LVFQINQNIVGIRDILLSERKGFENALYGVYASMRNDKAYGAYMTYYVMDVLAQVANTMRPSPQIIFFILSFMILKLESGT